MFGKFQQSQLRIEIDADAHKIHECLVLPAEFKKWLWPQRFSESLPPRLQEGTQFESWLGNIPVEHQVVRVRDNFLRVLLSKGVDGYHEWYWGNGWVQSRLEGISFLPLNAGQTASLFRLQQYLKGKAKAK